MGGVPRVRDRGADSASCFKRRPWGLARLHHEGLQAGARVERNAYDVDPREGVIEDPDVCIACEQCVIVCPVNAIFLDDDVPARELSVFEQLIIGAGAEYWYRDLFALRAGGGSAPVVRLEKNVDTRNITVFGGKLESTNGGVFRTSGNALTFDGVDELDGQIDAVVVSDSVPPFRLPSTGAVARKLRVVSAVPLVAQALPLLGL